MSNNKPIDRTKKSNIKCEHCKYWVRFKSVCSNDKSVNNGKLKVYWNRCKAFEWLDKESE